MKNINSNLVYILTFILIGLASLGITIGYLGTLDKNDDTESSELTESRPKPERNEEVDNQLSSADWRTETLALSDTLSINVKVPQDWVVEPGETTPPAEAENAASKSIIKAPETVNEDGVGTGVQFCLRFTNVSVVTDNIQAFLDTPATIQSDILTLGGSAVAQIKASAELPDAPTLLVSSNSSSERSPNSLLIMPDESLLIIEGIYGCEDNREAANTYPTAEEFTTRPEVVKAIEIIATAEFAN